MKSLVLLSLSLAAALGMPLFGPDVAQSPVLTKGDNNPVLGDVLPVQGHVVVEDPLPQVRLGDMEEQEDKLNKEEGASIESDPNLNPDVIFEPEADVQSKEEKEQKFKDDSVLMVESDVEVEPEVSGVQMDLLPETEPGPEFVNKKGIHEMLDEPIMELEPLDEDNMSDQKQSDAKLTEEEQYVRSAFQNQPVQEEEEEPEVSGVQMDLLPETKTEFVNKKGIHEMLDEPIMELEPEM
nr:cilia- and flagella-associated protein 251-like [Labrus bergylta]